jgi:hypothetical protein
MMSLTYCADVTKKTITVLLGRWLIQQPFKFILVNVYTLRS